MTTTGDLRPYDEIDISSPQFWASTAAEREESFAVLRDKRPVSWQRPPQGTLLADQAMPGFWAVARRADIVRVSTGTDVFISGEGVHFQRVPPQVLEATNSFLAMDAPRHTTLRKLVSLAFTPRQVARIEDQIAANARTVVEELKAAGSGADFVAHCASALPIRTISDMVGIPPEDRAAVARFAEALVTISDPDARAGREPGEIMAEATTALHRIAMRLAAARREDPQPDLMTGLVQARVDGTALTDAEIAAFFVLLAVAGNDTTRHTTSHALLALTDFPEQRAWLMEDFEGRIGTAVEEFIRWATPVMTFVRTAARDTELAGQPIAAGERVAMLYSSGNRDPEAFENPRAFDLSRTRNPHVGFGGGGIHFCLGNQVARAQLRAVFRELLHQLPDIRAGQPRFQVSSFIHGVRTMPCTFTA